MAGSNGLRQNFILKLDLNKRVFCGLEKKHI